MTSQRFAFWVTAVNLDSHRGVERVQTFANTIIDINCAENDTTADTEKVLIAKVQIIKTSTFHPRLFPNLALPSPLAGTLSHSLSKLRNPC